MGTTIDHNDCYTPQEFYNNDSQHRTRWVYIRVQQTDTSEGWIDNPDRHFLNITISNYSYRVLTSLTDCYWTNSADFSTEGYWIDKTQYNPDSANTLIAFSILNSQGYRATRCNSSMGSSTTPSVYSAAWFDYPISFVGAFSRLRDSSGDVVYVGGLGNIYRLKDGVEEKCFINTDNERSGIGYDTHTTTTYRVEIIMHDNRSNHIVPYINDVTFPSKHAFKRNSSGIFTTAWGDIPYTLPYDFRERSLEDWYRRDNGNIKSGLLPETLPFAKPYPYGKWYRDEDGLLITRGLPYPLIPQGAFYNCKTLKKIIIPNTTQIGSASFYKCINLREIEVPTSIYQLGEYTFNESGLNKATISRGCKYYRTTFPKDCNIYYYGGGSPQIMDIGNMQEYSIRELQRMTIKTLEGN